MMLSHRKISRQCVINKTWKGSASPEQPQGGETFFGGGKAGSAPTQKNGHMPLGEKERGCARTRHRGVLSRG